MPSHDSEHHSSISKAKVEQEAPEAPRTASLELVEGPGAPRTFVLGEQALVVGRDAACDIALPQAQLSGRHLKVTLVGQEFTCIDLDSAEGVLLNGVRIHSALLRDGDRLQLGNVTLLYRGRS